MGKAMPAKLKLSIPHLQELILLNEQGQGFSSLCGAVSLSEVQQELVRRIIEGGWTVEDLGQLFTKAAQTNSERVQQLITHFITQVPGIEIANVELPAAVDAVLVDRGWGGVARHALDLWEALNKEHRVLLICACEPPYGFDKELSHLLVTPSTLGMDSTSFAAVVSAARTILKKIDYRLLLFTHCAMAPFFFDIAAKRPTITFGDAYGEGTLALGCHLAPDPPEEKPYQFLQELFYGSQEPWANINVAKAYYWTFKYAAENWFWTGSQLDEAQRHFPELSNKFRLVLPLIDTDSFVPANDSADRSILFTTTSEQHKVGLKGLDPLLQVFERLPQDMRLRIVVNDRNYVAEQLEKWGSRVDLRAHVPKTEMLSLYTSCLANCRVSQDDSSPVSVLESMACGVPVIVSPVIARNIPVILDGVTGYVVEPDDIDTFENILRTLVSDPTLRHRVGEAGRRGVLRYSLANNLCHIRRYFDDSNHYGEPRGSEDRPISYADDTGQAEESSARYQPI
jgi:glycosyltransferase involved in cell wall biosynthesis